LRNDALVKDPLAAHTFIGTLQKDETDPSTLTDTAPEGVMRISYMERTKEFRDDILGSDIIIYDLMTNTYEEVDYVIKTLKASELSNDKTLILLSSVMTWVNTPPKFQKELEDGEEPEEPEEEEEEEEEQPEGEEEEQDDENGEPIKKKKILPFKESDYHLRVPAPKYQHLKTLETLAISSVKT
jgi:hypothetical protein